MRGRISGLDRGLFQKHRATVETWLGHLRSGVLDETKETSLHGDFLQSVFGEILGYTTLSRAPDGRWELTAEKSMLSGGSADGAIGFFEKGKSHVVAPIELKGATQFLDHAKGRTLTPIQQGWDCANKTPESRWIIVSNYRETRLYAKSRGQAAYELFRLEDLENEEGFLRFVALLGRDALLGGPPAGPSPLGEILIASERTEREITEALYGEYRAIRARLFDELLRRHPNIAARELLAFAQTILDRVLFLAFAEDRQLLPAGTIERAFKHRDPYHPRPIWENFVAVFKSVDQGNPALGIPAYNGGLFREVEDIAELEISDELCADFARLGSYDYGEDVSVDVLGHVFEQSITDLEQLRREAEARGTEVAPSGSVGTQKAPSKRQVEGIFYTPPFVTSFLVRETLGLTMAEAWERAQAGRGSSKRDRIAAWEAYQGELRRIRVLDPACGSGAFLIAAFDALAQEFDRANRALAELRGQQHSLFDLTRTVLNENLFGVDKSGESVEITKLSLWLKTAERNKKLTYIDRNIRQGNSVVSDPRVDPLAFDWGQEPDEWTRLLGLDPTERDAAAAVDARWREGFDVVLANPPYVRQELLTAYKEHWQQNFRAYDGTADLFVYFFERSLQQLKPGGRLGFIVSNKWLRGGYAEKLRALFARECTIDTLVDFGHAPIFPGTDAFPCIITLRKSAPPPEHAVRVTLYPREELGKELLASYVEQHRFPMAQTKLQSDGWVLEPASAARLRSSMKERSVTFGEYSGTKLFYGVKTGFNKAFLIDQETRDRLILADPNSKDLIVKYLRGQDMGRWAATWAGLWMIFARRGVDIDRYPAIKHHLERFRVELEPRPLSFTSDKWPGRKAGSYKWYELQDAVDYYQLFARPKLVVHRYMFHPSFCVVEAGMYMNDASAFAPTDDPWLLAVLNSPAFWYYAFRTYPHKKDETVAMDQQCVNEAPIPPVGDEVRRHVETLVAEISAVTIEEAEHRRLVLTALAVEFGVGDPGQALSEFGVPDRDAFTLEVKKRRSKGESRLTLSALKDLQHLYDTEAPAILEKRARILQLERAIASAVHEAYGLTADDLALLRETQPPRMPPGW